MRKFLLILIPLFSLGVLSLNAQQKLKCESFRKAKQGTYVIAHRGAHNGIPENSLPAYQKAIDLGCDFVEIDVRTTKDGKFVSVHNSTVDNYVNGTTGKVSDMTLAELKSLDIGARIGENWKNTRIPTFEEILALCKGKIGIYLDLKDAPVQELMNIIRKYNMESDVIWYVPSKYLLEMSNVDEMFGNSFIMPDPKKEENLPNVIKTLNPCVVATDMGVLSKDFVKTSQNAGAKVFVDEDKGTEVEWKQILKWKTDGIQTDDPEKLIKFLKSKH
ncbi:MAG: glycerophosphodiester phosphodiesterase family protein [Draconibacterium sp.]